MLTTGLVWIGLALAQVAPSAPPVETAPEPEATEPAESAAKAEAPLIPAFFTAETLYDICTRPNAGQCSMYITGTVDGMFLLEAARGRESFCLPQMTNREAADAVVDYLDDNPDVRGKAASAAIYEALTETFPCPDSEPATASGTDSE